MSELTLSEAVQMIGKSKSTLSRAIKSGRLSATRNADGTFSIDPAELLRAFPRATPQYEPKRVSEPLHATSVAKTEQTEISALRDNLAKAEQRAAVAEAQAEERARALEASDRTVAHLRSLLPPATPQHPVLAPSRSWWRRLIG